MSLFALLAIALALAMDAFAVAVTAGIRMQGAGLGHAARLGATFGFFQFIMPVIGWLLGFKAQKYIEAYDHWLAFGLLLFVGGKMLWESWKNRGQDPESCTFSDPTRGATLLMLGIATSLDAMAVGLSLAFLDIRIWVPAVIIGVVCFCVTVAGLYLGRLVCSVRSFAGLGNLGNKANVLGGLVLIAIGVGILREHGVFEGIL